MARRPGMSRIDPFGDLAEKAKILEQELAVQRAALERLKALGQPRQLDLPAEKARRSNVAFNRL